MQKVSGKWLFARIMRRGGGDTLEVAGAETKAHDENPYTLTMRWRAENVFLCGGQPDKQKNVFHLVRHTW